MRILYHSAAPWVPTGYGRCTKEIATRLHNGEHDVAVQCMNSLQKGEIMWHGEDELDFELERPMKIYPTNSPFGLGDAPSHFKKHDADIHFTHFDTWMQRARNAIPQMGHDYASYIIVDHYPCPGVVIKQILNAEETICMSKYAKNALEEKGVMPTYIPHGVNTEAYRPLSGDEGVPDVVKVRDEHGSVKDVDLDDTMLFGMVAANHGDRKRIPLHLEAFNKFLQEVDDSALMYLHTDPQSDKGFNFNNVVSEIGIPKQNLIWARPDDYGDVGDEWLNKWYNVFDCMMNCSQGESWGLTITEAMSAGTPVIATNFSSMPEQLGVESDNVGYPSDREGVEWIGDSNVGVAPHGLLVQPNQPIWRERVSSKQYVVSPDDICRAMRFYYENQDVMEQHGEDAREHVVNNYDWDNAVLPAFETLFERLEDSVA